MLYFIFWIWFWGLAYIARKEGCRNLVELVLYALWPIVVPVGIIFDAF